MASTKLEVSVNAVKTLGVVLVVCLSLLLNGVACVLIVMSMKQPPITDADVVVAGVGNSGNQIAGSSSARRLARQAADRNLVPAIPDSTLAELASTLIRRAREGDVEAAAFVFELAAAQRTKAQAATAPTITHAADTGR